MQLIHVRRVDCQFGIGYDADIAVLEDNYEVVQTFCKGVAQL